MRALVANRGWHECSENDTLKWWACNTRMGASVGLLGRAGATGCVERVCPGLAGV